MPGSEGVFIAIGGIGFLVLFVGLLFGEIFEHGMEFGHDLDVMHEVSLGHDLPGSSDLPAPSWLSIRVLAASLVGFSAVGFIADFIGLPGFLTWPLAAAGFLAVVAGTYFLILKPLSAQQYNSLMSRYSYVGQDAVVTLDILPAGTGQVTFRDRQGARVTQTASSDLSEAVSKGATVKIVDLVPGGVVVHRNSLSD
jgi:membrane protein implicated in regulation of membrane protease activity